MSITWNLLELQLSGPISDSLTQKLEWVEPSTPDFELASGDSDAYPSLRMTDN